MVAASLVTAMGVLPSGRTAPETTAVDFVAPGRVGEVGACDGEGGATSHGGDKVAGAIGVLGDIDVQAGVGGVRGRAAPEDITLKSLLAVAQCTGEISWLPWDGEGDILGAKVGGGAAPVNHSLSCLLGTDHED
eukprot:scaffold99544_cov36-Prasinocladus_malaysianus.AAC.1